MTKIIIYTDGAAKGNPGPGGYGVVLLSGEYRKELSGGFKRTTNNRMELLAVIVGLEALLKPSEVTIYSDSKYVVDSINKKWVLGWEKKNFLDKKNPDLWKRFLIVYRKHKVTIQWIKGHNNIKENEVCDKLAVAASESSNLLEDTEYLIQKKNEKKINFKQELIN